MSGPSHRKDNDMLAKSHSYCFIYKGLQATKKICESCPICTLKEARTWSQRIGELVHTVTVQYLNLPSRKKKRTTVDVQRLSLISHHSEVAEDGLALATEVI